MSDADNPSKPKKERSPSYPFISLKKAEERARQFWDKHRREAARISVVATTWKYELKSSGLAQTIGALKQYGILEDVGRGEDRKVQLSDLGRRLVADQRPGAREAALKEAATKPLLFREYAQWITDPPSYAHRLSELELDRGFNEAAAKLFLRAFDETVAYAGLTDGDSFSLSQDDDGKEGLSMNQANQGAAEPGFSAVVADVFSGPKTLPFSQRCKIEITLGAIRVTATLLEVSEVEKLAVILDATKLVLEKPVGNG